MIRTLMQAGGKKMRRLAGNCQNTAVGNQGERVDVH
jgi:hypothetical protein